MTNVQQPEMRRNGRNPLVQDSKNPRPGDPRRVRGGDGRRIPPEQVSRYGPSPRPVAQDADQRAAGRSTTRSVGEGGSD